MLTTCSQPGILLALKVGICPNAHDRSEVDCSMKGVTWIAYRRWPNNHPLSSVCATEGKCKYRIR